MSDKNVHWNRRRYCSVLFSALLFNCFLQIVAKNSEVFDGCGGNLYGPSGWFKSPDSDGDGYYDKNQNCIWRIVGSEGFVTQINILEFDVTSNTDCTADNLKIWDGFMNSAGLLDQYCNSMMPPSRFISGSGGFIVKFYSNGGHTAKGFLIYYFQYVMREGNLALGKPATQWRTTARNGFYWTADKGVDGCYERSDPSTSKCCSESTDNTEMHNFWRVNLKGQYEVEKVLIYDRVTYSALEGFALYITEVENGDEEIVYQDLDKNDVENDIYRIPVKRNVTEIIIRRASVYLKVCELQVFQAFHTGKSNVALGKIVTTSSVSSEGYGVLAVDGNRNSNFKDWSCTHTNREVRPWLLLNMDSYYTITDIHIWNRQDCCSDRLKDVHIEFGRTMEELTEIYYHSGEVGATLDIILEDEYTGQYLYIWLETDNGVLSICELEVNGWLTNVALGKSIQDSSSYSSQLYPTFAIDGFRYQRKNQQSFSHTKSENIPWMIVNLEDTYTIIGMRLFNRLDCCSERLKHVHIEVMGDSAFKEIYYYAGIVGDWLDVVLDTAYRAQYVRVWLESTNNILSLQELEVYAVCFPTPKCTDEFYSSFTDQHAIGDDLFTVNVLPPAGYYAKPSYGDTFESLFFSIENSTLDVATIDPATGKVNTTGNITVYPWFPSKNFSITVKVGNVESCYHTSTCTIILNVEFTNKPIKIDTSTANMTTYEDVDSEMHLTTILTSDDNAADEDNVTCLITHNPASSLIELVHDGNHTYDSYSIWKKECSEPRCGQMYDLSASCFNSQITNNSYIEIECRDAYGSSDALNLTLTVAGNEKPVLLNLPGSVNVSSQDEIGNVIFTAEVSNLPANESFVYKLQSQSGVNGTSDLFGIDNCTGEVFINSDPSQEASQTFEIIICVIDKRHEECGNLTIQFYSFTTTTTETTPGNITTTALVQNTTIQDFSTTATTSEITTNYTATASPVQVTTTQDSSTVTETTPDHTTTTAPTQMTNTQGSSITVGTSAAITTTVVSVHETTTQDPTFDVAVYGLMGSCGVVVALLGTTVFVLVKKTRSLAPKPKPGTIHPMT